MKNSGKPLWEIFPVLTQMVRQDHREFGTVGEGHDFLHALMVAQYGQIIAEQKRIGILSWVAGMGHNADRLFPPAEIEKRLKDYLEETDFSDEEKEWEIEAIVHHSELNDPNDDPVTIALKDADRLANIGSNILLRSSQHHPHLPAYNPRYIFSPHPSSTYRKPKSVLDDINYLFEWESWLRLPKAKVLAKRHFSELRRFRKGIDFQLREVKLLPYPFEED